MNDYVYQVSRLIRMMFYALALAVVGWGFSSYETFFAGLAVGLCIGIFSALYTAFKIHRVGEAAITGKRKSGLGMAARLSLAALGTIIVLRYAEHFEVVGYAIGLLMMPVFALGDAIYLNVKKKE